MPFDSIPSQSPAEHINLLAATPRTRMLYVRNTIIPAIPEHLINMDVTECGAYACLAGWMWRDNAFRNAAQDYGIRYPSNFFAWRKMGWGAREFLNLTSAESRHLFHPEAYPLDEALWNAVSEQDETNIWPATKLELTAHINDVLSGAVR